MSAHWAGAASVNQYSKRGFPAALLEFKITCFDTVICWVFKSNLLALLLFLYSALAHQARVLSPPLFKCTFSTFRARVKVVFKGFYPVKVTVFVPCYCRPLEPSNATQIFITDHFLACALRHSGVSTTQSNSFSPKWRRYICAGGGGRVAD
jgi:hypothetical protein